MNPVSVLVPCRAGSQRVPGKNTRPFGPFQHGLLELKLRVLDKANRVSSIVVSSDDPVVLEYATGFAATAQKHVSIVERPKELAIAASLDDFLAYVPTIMPPDTIAAWTHVTSPFAGAEDYDAAINAYELNVEQGDYDSLMSVNTIQTYLWNETGCISHDREETRWPQTQDLPKHFEVNSALFMIDQASMLERRDRIGDRPFLYEMDQMTSFDIDWPRDFEIGEQLLKTLGKTLGFES